MGKQRRICPLQYSSNRRNLLPKRLKFLHLYLEIKEPLYPRDYLLVTQTVDYQVPLGISPISLHVLCGVLSVSGTICHALLAAEPKLAKHCSPLKDTSNITSSQIRREAQQKIAPIEHYIVTSKGEEVTSVPDGKMKDVVIQIRLFGFRAIVVVAENCGKDTCRMILSCEHRAVKISFAQRNPDDVLGGSYKAIETVVFPKNEQVEAETLMDLIC
ncbi:uncharacterized protein EAE97_001157 [Botrytis byssoidea]|uniref:Uncharacterized protein n=1 Tax=Botrytis byssoidea TaxID=139641 RepID=A0A9P5IXQ5_9HELO|nr:uncharacterized protein EAE97_001157 [Botrytis byssoidea]KAF7953758.1 hypothetical protein EAE97_001157 [Botrytis byssoidea]